MTASFEVSEQDRSAGEQLSARYAEALRGRLIAEIWEWSARIAQDSAVIARLTANSSADPTSLDRAMATLRIYRAIEAIEEMQDALIRLADGRFGTCQSCDQQIPLERLEMIPQARFCAACPATADLSARSWRGPVRGERTGVLHPSSRALTVEGLVPDPHALAESRARHPSSVRYASPPDGPPPGQSECSRKPARDAAASSR
jgi:DnaK suppressor protein